MQFTFKFILFFSQFYLLVFCVHFLHNCHSKAFRSIKIQVMNGVFIRGFFLKILSIGWVTIKDRLTTRDRIAEWGYTGDCQCVFRGGIKESRNHVFFECSFTKRIWFTVMSYCLVGQYHKQCANGKITSVGKTSLGRGRAWEYLLCKVAL